MTKGTKIFRIVISILLGLSILWSAFLGLALYVAGHSAILSTEYDVEVAGVAVTRKNKADILGDGTVSYIASTNTLVFENALIEYDNSIIYSSNDIKVALLGENKFICKDNSYIIAICVADYWLTKDISFEGDGSLSIEYQNVSDMAVGIYGDDIIIGADINITIPDCASSQNGIACYSTLTLKESATVTINNGASLDSASIGVRGNAILEPGTTLNISVNPGVTDACRGLAVEGDLILAKDTELNATIDDEIASLSECIAVSGVMDIGRNAKVTASAKKAPAIECYTSIKINKDAIVSAESAGEWDDVFCYGAVVNYGATVNADIATFAERK